MGTFYVNIQIGDIHGQRSEDVEALVDTGATATMVPESVLRGLGITPTKREVFEYAGGERVELGMAPVIVTAEGKETPTWVIFGDEGTTPLLGAHALEGMFLGLDPNGQRLIPVQGMLKTAAHSVS